MILSNQEARRLGYRILAEPITALFTLLFVFNTVLWEISWLSYPLVVWILKRRGRAELSKAEE